MLTQSRSLRKILKCDTNYVNCSHSTQVKRPFLFLVKAKYEANVGTEFDLCKSY